MTEKEKEHSLLLTLRLRYATEEAEYWKSFYMYILEATEKGDGTEPEKKGKEGGSTDFTEDGREKEGDRDAETRG